MVSDKEDVGIEVGGDGRELITEEDDRATVGGNVDEDPNDPYHQCLTRKMVKLRMDFPADPVTKFRFDENTSQLSGALDGASIIDLKRTQIRDDLLVSPISAMFHFYHCLVHITYNLVITLEAT
ncbi:hypothetical protein JHK87_019490 [Glycine soja]|nr:hypothetical protein JHK87_019490 [Glycine soja]